MLIKLDTNFIFIASLRKTALLSKKNIVKAKT